MYENCLIVFLGCTAAALHMTGPSTYTASVGSIAHIPCTFTARELPADPRFFAVSWNLEGKEILNYDRKITSTNPRYSLDEDRALNGIADLTISNISVSDAGDYTCSVIYSPVRIQRKIRVDITATPTITIVNKVVTKSTKSNLNSTVSGFYPMDIDIKWLRDGQILDNVIIEKPQRNPYGTYSVNSSVIITPTEEDRERIFSCRVQHESLIEPLQEGFQLLYSVQPQLSILTKSVQKNTENTLACMVTGFFPPDIDVTWYKDGEVLNYQLMGEPHKNDNGTYQLISMVTITPSDDDQNRIFSCRVQHISLQEPLQEDFQLILEESSSNILIICIVILVVVIITAVFTGIILWKRKHKVTETSVNVYQYTSVSFPNYDSRQQIHSTFEIKKEKKLCNCFNTDNDINPSTNKELSALETGTQNSVMEPLLQQETSRNIEEKGKSVPLTVTRTPQKDETLHTPDKKNDDNRPSTNTEHPADTGNHNSESVESLSPQPKNVQLPDKLSHAREAPKEIEKERSEHSTPTKILKKEKTLHTPDNRQLPDMKVGEITVPKLIAGRRATLTCKLINFIPDEHTCSWYVKVKSGEIIHVDNDKKKHQSTDKDETSDDQNTFTAYLALVPVVKSDDGAEFILRVNLPDRVIERSSGAVHVKGQLPDLKVGEIKVPELIAGKIATLICKLINYIPGEHTCSWYVKVKSTGDVVYADYDKKKHQSTEKDDTSDDQNTFITHLALVPVEESDDGSEFILRVNLPDRVIERHSGAVHVRENLRRSSNTHKKNDLDVRTEETKDQCGESSFAENRDPQPSDREDTREPSLENQHQQPAEEEDNSDTVTAMGRSSSKMETRDEEEFSNLNDEAEDSKKPSPKSNEAAEDSSSQTDENIKENQNPESKKLEKDEISDTSLPIDTTSSKLQEGDEKEVDNL